MLRVALKNVLRKIFIVCRIDNMDQDLFFYRSLHWILRKSQFGNLLIQRFIQWIYCPLTICFRVNLCSFFCLFFVQSSCACIKYTQPRHDKRTFAPASCIIMPLTEILYKFTSQRLLNVYIIILIYNIIKLSSIAPATLLFIFYIFYRCRSVPLLASKVVINLAWCLNFFYYYFYHRRIKFEFYRNFSLLALVLSNGDIILFIYAV